MEFVEDDGGLGAVAADDPHKGCPQVHADRLDGFAGPLAPAPEEAADGLCRPSLDQADDETALQVIEDRGVPVPLSDGDLVDTQPSHLGHGRGFGPPLKPVPVDTVDGALVHALQLGYVQHGQDVAQMGQVEFVSKGLPLMQPDPVRAFRPDAASRASHTGRGELQPAGPTPHLEIPHKACRFVVIAEEELVPASPAPVAGTRLSIDFHGQRLGLQPNLSNTPPWDSQQVADKLLMRHCSSSRQRSLKPFIPEGLRCLTPFHP